MKKIFLCLMVMFMGIGMISELNARPKDPTTTQEGGKTCVTIYGGPGYGEVNGTIVCPYDNDKPCHVVCAKIKSHPTPIVEAGERVHLWKIYSDKVIGYANLLVTERTDITSGDTKNFKSDESTTTVDSYEELLKIDFIENK